MNLLAGIVIFMCLFLPEKALVKPQIVEFTDCCIFNHQDGLQLGDEILELDGEKIYTNPNISMILSLNPTVEHDVTVLREGKKLTFDNFVVLKGDEIAYALAKSLSDNTAEKHYNVTLFCGVRGIGKTHLLSAIYNRFTEENPTAKAVYFRAEQFVEDFMDSIRSNKSLDIERYLSYDLLLIDNLESLSQKEATIHYLMKIICELKNHEKRVVLASSQHPEKFSCYEHDRKKLMEAMVTIDHLMKFPR